MVDRLMDVSGIFLNTSLIATELWNKYRERPVYTFHSVQLAAQFYHCATETPETIVPKSMQD
jgi:hypothetical protein